MNRRVSKNPKKSFPQPKEMDYHVDQDVDEGSPRNSNEEAELQGTATSVDIGEN